jgi:hypothetical protein
VQVTFESLALTRLSFGKSTQWSLASQFETVVLSLGLGILQDFRLSSLERPKYSFNGTHLKVFIGVYESFYALKRVSNMMKDQKEKLKSNVIEFFI